MILWKILITFIVDICLHPYHLYKFTGEMNTHIKIKAYIYICFLFSYGCLLLKRIHLDHICTNNL